MNSTTQNPPAARPPVPWRMPVILTLGAALLALAVVRFTPREDSPVTITQGPAINLEARPVPEFSLKRAGDGKVITRENLAGHEWVVVFFYATCPGPCLTTIQHMSELQKLYGEFPNLRLVSISLTPERDTPESLREYATNYGADANRWWFLMGKDKKEIFDLSAQGFLLPALENTAEEAQTAGEVTHSPKFVLVNRRGEITRYFDGLDPQVTEQVRGALVELKGK